MRILVSSCLLGEDTRYDGLNSSIALNPKFRFSQKELFMDIMCENEIFSICPEVAGGLGIPRNKAEIKSHNKPRLYEIIQKGFAFEEAVKKAQENADELKALEEKFKIKK